MTSVAALEAQVNVPVDQEHAFTAFVGGLARWWPREFSWSGPDHLLDIGITPQRGATLWERGPFDARWDWGVVLDVEAPKRLRFSWQIGPDRVPVPHPDLASWVEVEFTPLDGGTRVTVVHDGFERHGDQAQAYREGLAGAWPYALDAYVTSLLTEPSGT